MSLYELLLDNVICHLNHFLTIFQGVHGGLCEHYFALFWIDVHLLLPKCVILQLFHQNNCGESISNSSSV